MSNYDYHTMLRSYENLSPVSSRLLQMRWDTTSYHKHRHSVRIARPIVDSKPPATYSHMHLKLKKIQHEEERMAVVERDNRILLEKMSKIMRTHGSVDHRNDYEYKSSNLAKRRGELLRVTRENQGVLNRLMRTKPQYSSQAQLQEWKECTMGYIDNLSKFPKNWWSSKKKLPAVKTGRETDRETDKEAEQAIPEEIETPANG